MKYLCIAFFAFGFLFSNPSSAQSDPANGFHIMLPDGWLDDSNVDLRKNLEKYELSDKEVADLMATHKGSMPIAVYLKYDRKTHPGIIPTIQVNLRPYAFRTEEEFKSALNQSTQQMALLLDNFEVTVPLTDVTIDDHQGVHFMSQFDMEVAEGKVRTIRSWTYAIPVGDYFYQINYSDIDGDDCSKTYEEVTEGLRF